VNPKAVTVEEFIQYTTFAACQLHFMSKSGAAKILPPHSMNMIIFILIFFFFHTIPAFVIWPTST